MPRPYTVIANAGSHDHVIRCQCGHIHTAPVDTWHVCDLCGHRFIVTTSASAVMLRPDGMREADPPPDQPVSDSVMDERRRCRGIVRRAMQSYEIGDAESETVKLLRFIWAMIGDGNEGCFES